MKKTFTLTLLMLCWLCSFPQPILNSTQPVVVDNAEMSLKYFNDGVTFFDKNDFRAADSLYNLSIMAKPNVDAYYNLAVTKIKLNDTCSSCHNLKKASLLGDETSTSFYSRFCSFDDGRMEAWYKAREARFTEAVNINPGLNSYLDLAIAKAKLGDQCGFCTYLQKSIDKDFKSTNKLFKKYCCTVKDISINDTSRKKFKVINRIYAPACKQNEIQEITFYRLDPDNDTLFRFTTTEVHKGIITDVETKENDDSSMAILKIDTTQMGATNVDHFTVNKIIRIKKDDPILLIVDVMPSFVGGEEALYKFLADNIRYPQVAREGDISGTVIIQFVVEKNGSLTQVTILKDIGGGCGEEAKRVIRKMPRWNPGSQGGKNARVSYQIPVKFSME